MADKKRTSIFSKILQDKARRDKAIRKAGGNVGKKGKRINTKPLL
jgi:hypothetical protein